jgi:hypothetical protein
MILRMLLSISLLAAIHIPLPPHQARVVEGQVISESTNKPVADVYVYIVEGEEEALTDKNGRFRIQTWQKFPLLLTIKYRDKPAMKVNITDAATRQVIRLKGV